MSDDVTPARGVLLSEAAAREVVAALDHLERLARPRGQQLSDRVRAIARELVSSGSRDVTRLDTRARPPGTQSLGEWEPSVVDTATAAQMLGITPGGAAWLCRHGHLRATRVGGRWLIDTVSLRVYDQLRKERFRCRTR